MSTHDKQGRPWAKLSELEAGDVVILDGDFYCSPMSEPVILLPAPDNKLYWTCDHGMHMLEGCADDGVHCIGVYHK